MCTCGCVVLTCVCTCGCVVCVCTCGVVCCVYVRVVLCVVLVVCWCCVCLHVVFVHGCCVVVVGWCGVWVWGGVGCLCFSLVFPLNLFILSLAVSLSVFSFFPSSLLSSLFSLLSSLPLLFSLSSLVPSRQQTLHKSTDQQTRRPTGRHGLWLRRRRLMSSIPQTFVLDQ